MLVIAILALFGNGYQYQKSFDICQNVDFKRTECKFHEKNVKNNNKSMHHKQ